MKELPQWLKHGTVWMLLGLGLYGAIQVWQARERATAFVLSGQDLELRRRGDGHYHWPGELVGPGGRQAVEFLVDTGATSTAIPLALAQQLGLEVVGSVRSNTAGGVVQGQLVLANVTLRGGVSAQRLRVTALPDLGAPLLGMDLLGRLRFEQSAGVMKIKLPGN